MKKYIYYGFEDTELFNRRDEEMKSIVDLEKWFADYIGED